MELMGLWGSFKVDAGGHGERTSLMIGEAEMKNEGPRKCLAFSHFVVSLIGKEEV